MADETLQLLTQIHVNQTHLQGSVETLTGKVESMDTLLRGNGKTGLILRVDRMEQTDKRRTWIIRTVLGAVLTLAVATVWGLVS